MATGAGAAAAVVGGSMESTLAKKFQSVTNTMESIQGLSTWCIDNKRYHSVIVRHWMKCLRKSDASHRLNLVYLANDVIQNCKRKNAIVYRTEFAEVLPEAVVLVNQEGDAKVIKSVERILSIWEERGVYSGTLIGGLRGSLVKEESPPETPVEQKTPVESKADLQSKIVAEFVPQALIDQLAKYKRSLEELDMREKQLAAMRVNICSSDALKKLKDKAGGKKFSKDFEEGNAQLQEFVKFFDKQNKVGPPVLEALNNADIFYEMQYKEVKIVANAYQTFANRVSHLKRKLDTLKANLPDLDDSPIPSPSADAPSPTGSESPFHDLELAHSDPDLDGSVMDDEAEPPAPSPLSSVEGSPRPTEHVGENDNREVEDMDLSEEETDNGGIIVEQQTRPATQPEAPAPVPAKKEPPAVATEQPVAQVESPVAAPAAAPRAPPGVASAAAPFSAFESVDLSKIGSILNSLSSVIKNTGPLAEIAPVAATPALSLASKDASSLVSLLSKVDMSPSELLGALSKVQAQSTFGDRTSIRSSAAPKVSSPHSTSALPAPSRSVPASAAAPAPSAHRSTVRQSPNSQVPPQAPKATEPSLSSKSLESKIHSFLQGNSAFNAFDLGFTGKPGRGANSPVSRADNRGGTPVRDEGGGTPTQDEIMDKAAPFASSSKPSSSAETAAIAYQESAQKYLGGSHMQQAHLQQGIAQNGDVFKAYARDKQHASEQGSVAPGARYQQFPAQIGARPPEERASAGAGGNRRAEDFQGMNEMGWYGDAHTDGSSRLPRGYDAAVPSAESKVSGFYSYKPEQSPKPPTSASEHGKTPSPCFFRMNLPPVPKLPPPPLVFEAPPPATTKAKNQDRPAVGPAGEGTTARSDSALSGMVVHDHQHKSMFRTGDEPLREPEPPRPQAPEESQPPREDAHHQEELEWHHEEHRRHDANRFQDETFRHSDEAYYRPASPPHQYRAKGASPPASPSEEPYYSHDYPRHSPPPPHYSSIRPPPFLETRHPGLRPPHRPPNPAHHPYPRGPPRAPFPPFHGPNPSLRGKRPGPRGGVMVGPMFPPKRPFPPPRY